MKEVGNADRQEVGREGLNNRAENSHSAVSTTGVRHAALSKHERTLQKFSSSSCKKTRSTTTSKPRSDHLVTRQSFKQAEGPALTPH